MEATIWFESIYREHADFCFRVGRRLLAAGQDEDVLYDIVQEVFAAAWQKHQELMNHPNIGGWLVLAVKYRVMGVESKRSRRARMQAYSLDDEERGMQLEAPQLSAQQQTELQEKVELLRELLGEENAALFLAYAMEGYKAKELGERFGLSENCVHVRISRMKKKLVAHPELLYVLLMAGMGAFRPL